MNDSECEAELTQSSPTNAFQSEPDPGWGKNVWDLWHSGLADSQLVKLGIGEIASTSGGRYIGLTGRTPHQARDLHRGLAQDPTSTDEEKPEQP